MNSAANQTTANKTHSLSLAYFGDEAVVSCFRLGADGAPDLENGEVFCRTVSAEAGRRVFQGYERMLSCSAAEFDATVDWVMHARASLGSCLDREVPNESRILRDAIMCLSLCTLKRRNAQREELRERVIASAKALLDRRNENLSQKIEAEAARRASLGQP